MNADQVKELLNNATPGDWRTSRKDMDSFAQGEDGKVDHVVYVYRGAAQPRVPVFAGPLDNARDDADLIASAPAVAQWGLERDAEVARLREALARVRGELNGAMASMDVSSTLTRQYVGAAWDALSEVVWGDS